MAGPHIDTVEITMFERNKDKPASSPAEEAVSTQSSSVSATPANARSAAMIGPSITIKGEISGDEDLLVQGNVEGSIKLKGKALSVGESGQVKADIQAQEVKIEGKVTGDITCVEKVVISKSGNVHGNIVAPRVTLEDGAIFKGSIDMDPGGAAADKTPLTHKQPANSPAPAIDLKSV
jgi:cytoskeletal protein CcmA (bactofilin family)